MKFRAHTGSLAASMDTLVTLPSPTMAALRNTLSEVYGIPHEAKITVLPYFKALDTRTGWKQTFMVHANGAIVGFTDEEPVDATMR